MNADRLLEHYARIADAPDAIARLRRFILDLAVRGKLVRQDPNDEPASKLLQRIEAEKARLMKAGVIRKAATLDPIGVSDIPFCLPHTWKWVRVGTVFDYDAGTKREPKELRPDRWLLELEDIEKDTSRLVARLRVRDRDSQSTKSEFDIDDILYGKLRPYLNKVVVADERGYSTTEIVAIRPFLKMCPDYCALAFRRPDFVEYVERLGQGTKMPRLRTPDAIVAAFPLPPVAEQHRIVAKVDELMALCDRLEAARAEREATRDRLAAASLARLNAPDPETFQDDARFALNALPALTTRPDQIKQIRQAILSLAVRGKLVPQQPSDKPAIALLKGIGANVGERRNRTDQPFLCPGGWSWATVQQTLENGREISYGVIKLGDEPKVGGVSTLRCSDVRPGYISLAGVRKVHESIEAEYARTRLSGGEIVVNIRGTLGGVALVPNDLAGFNVAREVAVIPISPEFCGRFLVQIFLSPYFWEQIQGNLRGIAYKGLNLGTLRDLLIPIPPCAEQYRIAKKVDELMGLCDQLEAGLMTCGDTRRRLLDALLAEALTPQERTLAMAG